MKVLNLSLLALILNHPARAAEPIQYHLEFLQATPSSVTSVHSSDPDRDVLLRKKILKEGSCSEDAYEALMSQLQVDGDNRNLGLARIAEKAKEENILLKVKITHDFLVDGQGQKTFSYSVSLDVDDASHRGNPSDTIIGFKETGSDLCQLASHLKEKQPFVFSEADANVYMNGLFAGIKENREYNAELKRTGDFEKPERMISSVDGGTVL